MFILVLYRRLPALLAAVSALRCVTQLPLGAVKDVQRGQLRAVALAVLDAALCCASLGAMVILLSLLTHSCPPFQHLLSERLKSLGLMGEPRVPPLNPSETIVL